MSNMILDFLNNKAFALDNGIQTNGDNQEAYYRSEKICKGITFRKFFNLCLQDTVFEECTFENCHQITMARCRMQNCVFRDIGALESTCTDFEECRFEDCCSHGPFLSVENALKITNGVKKVNDLNELFAECDYITIHIPLLKDNAGMFNKELFAKMKDGVVIVNCARGELVNNQDMIDAVKSGKVARHVTDFACEEFIGVENIIVTPHLGASTPEAEDNCAVMAARQLVDFIDNGNIVNSVNMPNCVAPRINITRITCCHLNQQNMIAQITSVFANDKINIENFVNKSKGDFAYTIIDTDSDANEKLLNDLREISGMIKVRLI